MNHSVKEHILADILFIKVDPQPPKDAALVEFHPPDYLVEELRDKISWFVSANNDLWPCEREDAIPTPIAIGDNVYQGGEWWRDEHHRPFLRSTFNSVIDTEPLNWNPSPTMPIELADKTYKVVVVEIQLVGDISIPRMGIKSNGVWMWKYTLFDPVITIA